MLDFVIWLGNIESVPFVSRLPSIYYYTTLQYNSVENVGFLLFINVNGVFEIIRFLNVI